MKSPAIWVLALFILSSSVIIEHITERSSTQVVLIHSDAKYLKNQIEIYYNLGYRVVGITSQGIAFRNNWTDSRGHDTDMYKGQMMVIMEK